jgi:hypothetical protein
VTIKHLGLRFLGAMALLSAAASAQQPLPVVAPLSPASRLATLDALLRRPHTAFFQVSRDAAGKWATRHGESYYAGMIDNQRPVFTVANGPVVVAVAPNGAVREICLFGETRRKPSDLSGGWVTWKRTIVGPVNFKIEAGGRSEDPAADWTCRTSFLCGALPVTEYQSANLRLRVIACPPVSADGRQRPRAMLWGISLRNASTSTIAGAILLSAPANVLVKGIAGRSEFTLKTGEQAWWPVLIASREDAAALAALGRRDAVAWLQDTCAYWRRVTGDFSMPGDPFTAELFTRMTVLSLETGAFDPKGRVAGVLYGTYPFQGLDNFRDAYYSILPATQRDPALLRPFLAWFARYAVRPREPRYPGGVSHSLGNSLNAVMLAGLYYEATGDRDCFATSPELMKTLRDILEAVLASRKSDGPWLFPSSYVSDGRSLGDYHTGSNVCAWYAFRSFARILEEACGDTATAARYRDIARRIKADLDGHNIIDSPLGPRYVEGRNADGSLPAMIHDGEESDTTLMPFYGYCAADFPAYRNFMRFAASPSNAAFSLHTRGIVWETYGPNASAKPAGPRLADATFPGYVTALAGCTDRESLRGKDGYLNEIRRLTDVNGTWWWWPYNKGWNRGHVQRAPFECGWAEGVFSVLFPANFLGIAYDAPQAEFRLAPLRALGAFTWSDFPIGSDRFSVSYRPDNANFKNSTPHPVALEVSLPAASPAARLLLDGQPLPAAKCRKSQEGGIVKARIKVAAGQSVDLQIAW